METYINATQESGRQFYQEFKDKGKVVMLNLLRFRAQAYYNGMDAIKPEHEVSGSEAYQQYAKYTFPILEKFGSKVLFYGNANHFLIGPETEKWDSVLLVQHESVDRFLAFAKDEDYLKTAGHRTAALEDSRLLPITENKS